MIVKIVVALVVGALAWLLCIALGGYILPAAGFPPLVGFGHFLVRFAVIIGVIVAVLYYFFGRWTPSGLRA